MPTLNTWLPLKSKLYAEQKLNKPSSVIELSTRLNQVLRCCVSKHYADLTLIGSMERVQWGGYLPTTIRVQRPSEVARRLCPASSPWEVGVPREMKNFAGALISVSADKNKKLSNEDAYYHKIHT